MTKTLKSFIFSVDLCVTFEEVKNLKRKLKRMMIWTLEAGFYTKSVNPCGAPATHRG